MSAKSGKAFLEFSYTGTRVDMQIARGPRGGNAMVWIDGVSRGQVDFYRSPSDPSKPDNSGKKDLTFGEFVSFETEAGDHVFRLDVTNDNPDKKRDMIYVDGFVIENGATSGNATFSEGVQVVDGIANPLAVVNQPLAAAAATSLVTGVVEVADTAAVNFLALDPLGQVAEQSTSQYPTRAVSVVPQTAGLFTFQLVNTGLQPVSYRMYLISSDNSAAKAAIGRVVREDKPTEYVLRQNYPNPFNPQTTIPYDLPEESHVRLRIYNVYGQEVESLVDRVQPAGRYELTFNAGEMASGIYFYKLTAGAFSDVKRLIIMK